MQGRVGKYNVESLKQGSKRFNSIKKTIHFAYLGILFICANDPMSENLAYWRDESKTNCNVLVQYILFFFYFETNFQQYFFVLADQTVILKNFFQCKVLIFN